MEKLYQYLDSCLLLCRRTSSLEVKEASYNQAFGALQFFWLEHPNTSANDIDDIWDKYRHEFHKQIYGDWEA